MFLERKLAISNLGCELSGRIPVEVPAMLPLRAPTIVPPRAPTMVPLRLERAPTIVPPRAVEETVIVRTAIQKVDLKRFIFLLLVFVRLMVGRSNFRPFAKSLSAQVFFNARAKASRI